MTNEEIVKRLKRPYNDNPKEWHKALDAAIQVIERQPCEDAVSREALIDKATSWDAHFTDSEKAVSLADIMSLPSVTPQPKTGEWITTRTFMHDVEFYCDKCKCDSPNNEKWDYCPHCGAKMGGGEDGRSSNN